MNKFLPSKTLILVLALFSLLLSSNYSYGQCNEIVFYQVGGIEATTNCVNGTATFELTITVTVNLGVSSSICVNYEEGGVEKRICLNGNYYLNEVLSFTADCGSFFQVAAYPEANGGGQPCINCGPGGNVSCIEDLISPLPVELSFFEARLHNDEKGISLEWNTVTEINNLGFEVERSTDGRNWETLDFVPGRGTTTTVNRYTFEDEQPKIGYNYYRLKQIDFDGDFKYSEIVSVLMPVQKGELLKIFPNPSSGTFQVSLSNPNKEKVFIKLLV